MQANALSYDAPQRAWDWDLMIQLGDPDDEATHTEATAQKLRETSLLGEMQERRQGRWIRLFHIHQAMAKFITAQIEEMDAKILQNATYLRIGTYLESLAKTPSDIRTGLDAGYYLFRGGAIDRAFDLLESAAIWLLERGLGRESLVVLESFEGENVMEQMDLERQGRGLSVLGISFAVWRGE